MKKKPQLQPLSEEELTALKNAREKYNSTRKKLPSQISTGMTQKEIAAENRKREPKNPVGRSYSDRQPVNFNKSSRYINSVEQRKVKELEKLNKNIRNKQGKKEVRAADVLPTIREESKNDILRENLMN